MELKSLKNRLKIRSNFWLNFWVVPGSFLVDFGSFLGSPDPQKWVFRVGEVLFLRKSRFSGLMRFWIDFLSILDGFGCYFRDHFGIKVAFKNQSKNQSDFGSILEGFWPPNGIKFWSIFAPKIDQKSRSIFERFFENPGGRVGASSATPGRTIGGVNPS